MTNNATARKRDLCADETTEQLAIRAAATQAVPTLALRPKDAAKAIGIGERKLWEMTNCGTIPHVRFGKAIVYPVAVLERWLAEKAKGRTR